tara:strand:- start:87 stop:809 length:723 start_codon:yes stop_codon:yes gene_type:complete
MYLTDEKKLNVSLSGLFYTRRWNDHVPCIYFEKIIGKKPLLKKIYKKSRELKIIFNSSMVSEIESDLWEESGWVKKHTLFVCESNLLEVKKINPPKDALISCKLLNPSDIPLLLEVDKNIFDPYWRNSYSNFIETIKTSNNNYLFKIYHNDIACGYGILGETRGFTYLQRFGIDKTFQKKGMGWQLLSYILSFAKAKNFKKMKLNTQSTNQAALSLYTNNTFEVLEKKLVIMGSASHKQE